MTDEEAERIFGGGLVIFGQKRPQPSSESSVTPESGSATEADPMQPAVDAIEEWGPKTFGGRADPGGQEEHDRWLQSQSASQVTNLARNLADLMRTKDGSGARIKFPVPLPAGCSFFADFSGDDWVRFPDGTVFKLDGSTGELLERPSLPREATFSDEAYFLRAAAAAASR
jgi:hypothetical protein